MAFPREPRDIRVEIYIGGAWVDITADVYAREAMQITRGRGDNEAAFSASRCGLTLDNRAGKYNIRNPLGPYYGQLGRNTPIRVTVRTATGDFSQAVTNGWGSTATGQTWTNIGSGGTVQASDFQVAGGVGTHSVPVANGYRASYIPLTVLKHRDVDVAVTVTIPFTDVTGANIEPATIMLRVDGTPNYYKVVIAVTPAEAVTIELLSPAGFFMTDATTTVPGLTHSASQALRIRAQAEGQTIRAKVWPAASVEPFGWHAIGHHATVDPHNALVPAGGVGIRSGVATGNTNAKPIVFSYDDLQVRVPRFAGEVSSWPQRWNEGTTDAYVTVEAAGPLRRLSQGAAPFLSSPRRYIPKAVPPPEGYWPLEDAPRTGAGRPVLGSSSMTLSGAVSDQTRMWSNGQLAPWLANVLAREGLNDLSVAGISMPAFAGAWRVAWVMAGGKANNDVLIQSGQQTWRVEFSATADSVKVTTMGGAVASTTYPPLFDGALRELAFDVVQISPTTYNWHLYAFTSDSFVTILGDASFTGVIEPVAALTFRNLVDNQSNPLAIGHVVVNRSSGVTGGYSFSFVGEAAGVRIRRLCGEEGVPFSFVGDLADTPIMGPQYPDTFLGLIAECAEADQGELYESRGTIGIEYRTRKSLYNQASTLPLVFASDHLAPPLDPVDDDSFTRNDVTVQRRDGGQFVAEQKTGPLSTTGPSAGGIGRYATSVTVNVGDDDQLPDMASWLRHLGTVDEARYPQVNVSMARSAIANDSAVANAAMDVNIGDRATIDSASQIRVYSQISQIVRGYTETLDAFQHDVTMNCTPESPYQVVQADSAGKMKANTGGSVLHVGVTSSATSLDVATTIGPPWVTAVGQMPVPITVSGEDLSATAIADELITFVAAGTAAHADRGVAANVTPGLPAGHTSGDVLLCLAAMRRLDVPPTPPTGYALLADIGNLRLFGKIDGGSESAPVVDFSGGSSGDTISAQMACFRGKFHDINNLVVNGNGHLNGSAQDIPYTGVSVPYSNCLVLYLGWKQDDWTSVASPGTEIDEPATTIGNDQGMVWAYTIQTTATGVASGQFAVTGGATAVSRAGVVVLRGDRQTFTVTRSVNGVQKSHSAGAAVALTRRATAGL